MLFIPAWSDPPDTLALCPSTSASSSRLPLPCVCQTTFVPRAPPRAPCRRVHRHPTAPPPPPIRLPLGAPTLVTVDARVRYSSDPSCLYNRHSSCFIGHPGTHLSFSGFFYPLFLTNGFSLPPLMLTGRILRCMSPIPTPHMSNKFADSDLLLIFV